MDDAEDEENNESHAPLTPLQRVTGCYLPPLVFLLALLLILWPAPLVITLARQGMAGMVSIGDRWEAILMSAVWVLFLMCIAMFPPRSISRRITFQWGRFAYGFTYTIAFFVVCFGLEALVYRFVPILIDQIGQSPPTLPHFLGIMSGAALWGAFIGRSRTRGNIPGTAKITGGEAD